MISSDPHPALFCLLPLLCDPTQESLTYSLLPPAPLRPLHGPLFSLDLVLDQLGAHYSCHLTSFQPCLVDIFERGILPHMPHHRERRYGGVLRVVCTQVLLSTAGQACWLVVSYWRWLLSESHTYGTLQLISVTVSSTSFLQCQLYDAHTSSAHSQTLSPRENILAQEEPGNVHTPLHQGSVTWPSHSALVNGCASCGDLAVYVQ